MESITLENMSITREEIAPVPMPAQPVHVMVHAQGTHATLKDLLADMQARVRCAEGADAYKVLFGILKEQHYWPALQLKTFSGERGMALLHNTYKRDDVASFQMLYDECRSVVLDLSAPESENIVVSLANCIPDRVDDVMYECMNKLDVDNELPVHKCERSYEGTVVSVFFHRDKWFFSTSTCPNVNDSRFAHPTKKHGEMFDEALERLNLTREMFTNSLDQENAYTFLLVHHENGHIMKTADEFGDDKFMGIFHIGTRSRETMEALACDVQEERVTRDQLKWAGVMYPERYESPAAAIAWLRAHPEAYGFVARREDGSMMKVSSSNIIELEQMDYGNSNPWHNFVWIYKQNKPHFHVNDYIARFCPEFEAPLDHANRQLAPVYMIHTVMCTMRDILLHCYQSTTQYFPQYARFRMNKEVDGTLAPIMRFHLAQLRRIQITTHTHEMVNAKTIYHYLCHHTTMKNLRMLVKFFAHWPSQSAMMNARAAECFAVLDACMSD
jgi:hypothetical protein